MRLVCGAVPTSVQTRMSSTVFSLVVKLLSSRVRSRRQSAKIAVLHRANSTKANYDRQSYRFLPEVVLSKQMVVLCLPDSDVDGACSVHELQEVSDVDGFIVGLG